MLLLLTCSHSNLVSVQNTHLLTVHLNTLKAPYCINYVSLSDWLSKDWLPPFLTGIDRLVLCEFPKWKLCLNEGKWVNWSGKLFFMCTCMVMMMMYIWIQRTGISLGAIWQLSLYCNHSILLVSIQATSFSKLSGIKVSRFMCWLLFCLNKDYKTFLERELHGILWCKNGEKYYRIKSFRHESCISFETISFACWFHERWMDVPSTISEFIFGCVVFRDIMIPWMQVIWMKTAIYMSCLELMMWSMLPDTEFQQAQLKRLVLPDSKIEEWKMNKESWDWKSHKLSHFLSAFFDCISTGTFKQNTICFRSFLLRCFPVP